MSRITTPASIEAAPAASHGLLEAVKIQLGSVPNLFRLVATSPAALEGYLGMSGALSMKTRRNKDINVKNVHWQISDIPKWV